MKAARLGGTARLLCLFGPLWAIGFFAMARFVVPAVWTMPRLRSVVAQPCVMRTATGVPCPFCGGTRSVVHAAHGRWSASLLMSPLGALLIAGGPLGALWLALCAATGRDLGLTAVGRFFCRRLAFWCFLVSLLALWAWKIVAALWLSA